MPRSNPNQVSVYLTDERRLVLEGKLRIGLAGDNDDALLLGTGTDSEPLARVVQEAAREDLPFWSVRYFVSDQERHGDEWTEALLGKLCGRADVEYRDVYSDITGYLWTEETLVVGGHDILGELASLVEGGRTWLRLEITMHREDKEAN